MQRKVKWKSTHLWAINIPSLLTRMRGACSHIEESRNELLMQEFLKKLRIGIVGI